MQFMQLNTSASKKRKIKNMTTLHLRKSINCSPWRFGLPRVQPIWIIRGFLLITLTLACLALAPTAQAVTPSPDGGYPNQNTAEGANALQSLTTGIHNTATGWVALFHNTTGNFNTATGSQALKNNIANDNTADGFQALLRNTTGADNTATGWRALYQNTTGNANTATGVVALFSNTTGIENTAIGDGALGNNNTGSFNTATGNIALLSNTTGHDNTANGFQALLLDTTGFRNTAIGGAALFSNTTGSNNIALGSGAGDLIGALTPGNNNIDIGNEGGPEDANKIRIGTVGTQTATFIAGIRAVTTENMDAVAVVIDSAGQLGTTSSSRRFKKEIKPMDQTSEAILSLKPVTFQYKSDSKETPQFGLIAEEVAKVNPDLVVRNADGEIYTVRYEAVNAMLLNEFLKEHRKVKEQDRRSKEQEATIAQLKKDFRATVAELTARLEEQDSKIQEVSAQVEVGKPGPRTVLNNQ
jgi:hypothetical protein